VEPLPRLVFYQSCSTLQALREQSRQVIVKKLLQKMGKNQQTKNSFYKEFFVAMEA